MVIDWTAAAKQSLLLTMKQHQLGLRSRPAAIVRSAARACVLPVVCLCLTACKPDTKGPDGNDPTGVYALVTVNGARLPATVSHGDAAIEVRSGTFTINADGTCSSKVIFGPPLGAEATREVHATYTREGPELNMQWEGAGRTTGTLEGNTFTMINEGMVLAYRRQPTLPAPDGE